MIENTTIEKLFKYLLSDNDFKYVESNRDYIEDNIELFIIDKKYVDISYIVIDKIIFDLDEIYMFCLEE